MKIQFHKFMSALMRLEKRHGLFVKQIYLQSTDETYSTTIKRKKAEESKSPLVNYFGKKNKKALTFKALSR